MYRSTPPADQLTTCSTLENIYMQFILYVEYHEIFILYTKVFFLDRVLPHKGWMKCIRENDSNDFDLDRPFADVIWLDHNHLDKYRYARRPTTMYVWNYRSLQIPPLSIYVFDSTSVYSRTSESGIPSSAIASVLAMGALCVFPSSLLASIRNHFFLPRLRVNIVRTYFQSQSEYEQRLDILAQLYIL